MSTSQAHAEVLNFILGAGTLLGRKWEPGHRAYVRARGKANAKPSAAPQVWEAALDEVQTLWLAEPARR